MRTFPSPSSWPLGRACLIAVAAGLGLTPAALAQCPPSFAPAVNYVAGTGPWSVAVGDFNRDGRPDLAVANANSYNVSVLLNNGLSISFSQQPQSQSAALGTNVMFAVTAAGAGPFSYQWRRDELPIIGATAATLNITGVSETAAGVYDVQVRGGCNPAALVISRPAILLVGSGATSGCFADVAGGGDNGLSPDGVVDGSDYIAFINAFATGC